MFRGKKLEILTNLALLAASGFVVVTYARLWLTTPQSPAASYGEYVAGDIVPPIPGISYGNADASLLLFVNSSCHFCTESMPFYRGLLSTRNKAHVSVIALSRENEQEDPSRVLWKLPDGVTGC
jgi:hypothetical protein